MQRGSGRMRADKEDLVPHVPWLSTPLTRSPTLTHVSALHCLNALERASNMGGACRPYLYDFAMADVLVVDDVVDVADSFGRLLTVFGHEVRVAYSAAQALAQIDQRVPDIVLSEITLPVFDGLQLARKIRRRWGTGIRLVALTAHPRGMVAPTLAQAGFDSLVSKSAPPSELALVVEGRLRTLRLPIGEVDRRRSPRISSASRRAIDDQFVKRRRAFPAG